MPVWLTLAGSPATPTWSTAPSATGSPPYCLRAAQCIQTQVREEGREGEGKGGRGGEGRGREIRACYYSCVGISPLGRYWEMVSRLRVTQLYLAPTAIRMLYRFGESWVNKYDRSSLRVLGSGELGRGGREGLGE